MSDKIVLGVDIGGTHITAALVDLETKSILPETKKRAQVNSQGTVREVIETWGDVIKKALGTHPAANTKLGVAIPGPFDYEQGICQFRNQNKYDSLYGLNVKELLAEQLGAKVGNIRLVNDAACFLRGEVFAGTAKDASSAIGLTLGTGLGSAILQNGVAEDAKLWCAPFKDSIAEEYLSTRAFLRAYERLTGKAATDVKQLAALYPQNAAVRQVFEDFAENLALFLAPYLREVKPEMVVIGGNIANAWELFIPTTTERLRAMGIEAPIHKVALAEEAALIGAASYWHETLPELKQGDS
ncbi:ROK family protein [Pontibacter anaerobius]|uniref:ROK family protein n=1 Tax=Pontibacter anaerobius TaxID=2993940 RepID=A0ABT3RD06_9BACT|nr:ROK family protein [Pontibacter anaerobius]MCX2739736.1 ROK family protein [Pontibacter anaerobius]